MDPRDRLWHDLVFVRCDTSALLALRAVCRAFRAQLRDSRLWLLLTMAVSRMRYDERLAGWAGVDRAMKREDVTRANCDAGRYTRGPVLDVHDRDARCLMFLGGRIAVFCRDVVQLFDVDTGSLVAAIDVRSGVFHYVAVVDRWILHAAEDGRAVLLDCVAARLVELTPADPSRGYDWLTVAGPCVSYRMSQGTDVTVVHISGGPDGATIMRETARVRLAHAYDEFALCERGHSYLLCGQHTDTLQLFDIAAGQLRRTFTPRACSPLIVLLCGGLTHV